MKKKKLLVIYHIRNPHQTPLHSYRHIHVLDCMHEKYEIDYFNAATVWKDIRQPFLDIPQCPDKYREGEYDSIILHYTFLIMRCIGDHAELLMEPFEWLSDVNCQKLAIPQDEGNHAAILDDWLFRWGVHIIFSVHYHPDGNLYRRARSYSKIISCLPGYVNKDILGEHLQNVSKIADRNIDIVYRGRPFNLRYGRASYIKSQLAGRLERSAKRRGLCTNISVQQEDRIYGDRWFDFISSSKSVFGVFGGYSAVDMRGEVKEQVEYLKSTRSIQTLEDLNAYMPNGWDNYELFTVTPRHFESIACRTAQILLRHHYKGVLQADLHYIPLNSDCSNLEEVLDQLQDDKRLQDMVDRSFEDIYQSGIYDYERFAELISNEVDNGINDLGKKEGITSGGDCSFIDYLRKDKEIELTRAKYIYLQLREEYQENEEKLGDLARKDKKSFRDIFKKAKKASKKLYRRVRIAIVRGYYYARRIVVKLYKKIVGV